MTDERWRTDTAERPAVVAPPAAPTPPPSSGGPAAPSGIPAVPPARTGPVRRAARPPAPPWIAWVVVAAVLVTAAFVGAWLVVQDPGATTATDPAPAERADPPAEEAPEDPPAEDEDGAEEPPPEDAEDEPAEEPVEITGSATAEVPGAAPSNNDVTGELVTFVADNLLDGDSTTCWRIAGDATDSVLTFTFPGEVTITGVGMFNGYAKTSVDDSGQEFDWYHGNRRVLSAEWVIGGQTFPQTFADTTEFQPLDIEPTETTTVELRLVEVSPPGAGPTRRDYTAISGVAFGGFEQ